MVLSVIASTVLGLNHGAVINHHGISSKVVQNPESSVVRVVPEGRRQQPPLNSQQFTQLTQQMAQLPSLFSNPPTLYDFGTCILKQKITSTASGMPNSPQQPPIDNVSLEDCEGITKTSHQLAVDVQTDLLNDRVTPFTKRTLWQDNCSTVLTIGTYNGQIVSNNFTELGANCPPRRPNVNFQ